MCYHCPQGFFDLQYLLDSSVRAVTCPESASAFLPSTFLTRLQLIIGFTLFDNTVAYSYYFPSFDIIARRATFLLKHICYHPLKDFFHLWSGGLDEHYLHRNCVGLSGTTFETMLFTSWMIIRKKLRLASAEKANRRGADLSGNNAVITLCTSSGGRSGGVCYNLPGMLL